MQDIFDMNRLNSSQKRVVLLPPDAHILCVAGPGSGKTRTVTCRLGYLVMEQGILPSRLRAVTFSREATNEMKDRLSSLNAACQEIQISTIHRLCRDIIKETQGAIPENRSFQSYIEGQPAFKKKNPDQAISQALVRHLEKDPDRIFDKIIEELDIPSPKALKKIGSTQAREVAKLLLKPSFKGNPRDIFQSYITYRKTQMHCHQFIPDAKLPQFSLSYAQYVLDLPTCITISTAQEIAFYEGIYRNYCKILTEWQLFDFTDQILFAHLGLLFCSEQTRLDFRSRWDVLAVDEFQDVDAVQFEVFHQLCMGQTRLNAVGDPDQAIYGFRGGDASFISGFRKWFPSAEVVQLDTNYRSYTDIIDVAYSAVASIDQNYRAKGESSKGIGGRVGFDRLEAVEDFSDQDGSVGVLAWTNKTLTRLSRTLLFHGVVCAVKSRYREGLNVPLPTFRIVFETLQAFGMVTGDIDFDRELFLKYAQHMKGIAGAVMKAEGSTLAELRRDPKVGSKVGSYVIFLRNLRGMDVSDQVRYILSDYFLSQPPRIEIRETLAKLDFSQTYEEILQAANIQLCTIHRAKGLEFDTVFVDTGDFAKPFAKDNLDESRRLLFVALSRAKDNLFLLGGEEQGNRITAPVIEMINLIQTAHFSEYHAAAGVDVSNALDVEGTSNSRPIESGSQEDEAGRNQLALPAPEAAINYRDEGLYSEDGFDFAYERLSEREKKIQEVSAQLQVEFPGRYELESDLRTVGPTPFIINKIRKARRT